MDAERRKEGVRGVEEGRRKWKGTMVLIEKTVQEYVIDVEEGLDAMKHKREDSSRRCRRILKTVERRGLED